MAYKSQTSVQKRPNKNLIFYEVITLSDQEITTRYNKDETKFVISTIFDEI